MCNNILQYAHLYAWGREHHRATLSMRFAYKYRYFHICDTPHHSMVWYLMGKYQYHVGPLELRKVVTKFIFMSLVRQYYGLAPESSVERNFADLRDVKDAQGFVDYFNKEVELNFTEDFFTKTLPDDLHSSSAISPSWYGYIASINVLGTPMLFSTSPLSVYWEKGGSGKKKAIVLLIDSTRK